ncbi:MAG TPA: carboxypeptidase regulatory-like domain-containing protein [Vicinamibacterales bacterium]|nr:carboxypeptidase regulatory-like domain-containing protein [Vicinamibacterales bacterium]
MKGSCGIVSTVVLIVFVAASTAWAQATAQLSGRVTDDSGGVLPGVTVTVTQTDTGFTRTTVTDDGGGYVLPNLPLGPYRLEAMLAGFRTFAQTGIVLQVGATPAINVTLGLGELAETVTVEAAAPLVDTQSAGISEVVEQERIVELPLQGRQVTDLIVLAGGAVEMGRPNNRSFQGGVNIAVAGGMQFGVSYLLDGALHNDPQNAAGLALPFPDALQEFRVATSGLSADNGVRSGASVNAVTRSGTNRYSGNGFEFYRDAKFNAISRFAPIGPDGEKQDDGLTRHQFGGTFGGPVMRDRLFFFGAYQQTETTQQPAPLLARVPTAQMLAGDFTTFASAACQGGAAATLRAPFVGNRVNPATFSPAALNLAGRLPNTTDPCGETLYSVPLDRSEGQFVGRVDYQLNANHTIFGRYMATTDNTLAAFARTNNPLTTTEPALDNLQQALTLGDTQVFGANVVNAIRFAYTDTDVDRQNAFFDPSDLGAKAYSYIPDQMTLNVTGGFDIGASTAAKGIANNQTYALNDDLSIVKGRHQLGMGVNVAYWKVDQQTWARGSGQWTFTGQATGLGMADFLLGRVAVLDHSGLTGITFDQKYLGAYLQDTWRMNPRVTINAGVRWEPFFSQNLLRGAITRFDREDFRDNVISTEFKNAPAGLIYPGDPGFPDGSTGLKTKWMNFAPRAGIGWDVRGDGRLAIRSSYGLSYDYPTGEFMSNPAAAPPYGNRIRLTDPPGGFDDPYGHLPGGDPHPIVPGPDTVFPASGTFASIDPDLNAPRIQSWNVTVEQQLGTNWQVSASYLGRYSDRLWGFNAVNYGVFMGLGPCTINGVAFTVCTTNGNLQQRRVLSLANENPRSAALIGILDEYTNDGDQSYRGMRLSLQRRATTGLSFSTNYTLSRCYGLEMGTAAQFGATYTDPTNPDNDRGFCDQDRTHIANATVGIETPQFGNAVLRAIASNWGVSAILTARSGARLSVVTGVDTAFSGISNQRGNQVSDSIYGNTQEDAQGRLANYLNRDAFAVPAPGSVGTSVRNGVVGPSYWNGISVALRRLISLTGTQNIELRIEAFNLLNSFSWGTPAAGSPTVNLASGQFGRITTQQGDPRIMQFGIKYAF